MKWLFGIPKQEEPTELVMGKAEMEVSDFERSFLGFINDYGKTEPIFQRSQKEEICIDSTEVFNSKSILKISKLINLNDLKFIRYSEYDIKLHLMVKLKF